MKSLQFNNRTFTVQKSNKEDWQEFCKEMSDWFGKPCYWTPYRYDINKLKLAFNELQEKNDHNFSHLLHRAK